MTSNNELRIIHVLYSTVHVLFNIHSYYIIGIYYILISSIQQADELLTLQEN